MTERQLEKKITNYLNYTIGKLNGIKKMRSEKRKSHHILDQLLAAQAILDKIISEYYKEQIRMELWLRINRFLQCENISFEANEKMYSIKEKFHHYKLKQLHKIFLEIEKLEGSISKN